HVPAPFPSGGKQTRDFQNVYFLRIGIAEKKQDRITKENAHYPLIFYGNCIKIDVVLQCAADFQKVYFWVISFFDVKILFT
ncbi:hypothetical protein, partial [uncultured Acetatifactor sp.]|uniref:hypothetical protein n=1 Tax=uncultured Acetatifactor sp. TaxID=1671927 RepID=UPI002631601E